MSEYFFQWVWEGGGFDGAYHVTAFWCESSADPGEGDLLKSGEKGKRSGLNGWTIESWIEVRAGQNRLLGAGYGMSSQIR